MRLEFKKDLLNPLGDKKEIFEKYILPMLAMNNKFILTGSLSLKLLGFEPIEGVGDFDLALLDKFTEEDYHNIKNFFGLHDNIHDNNYGNVSDKPFVFDLKARLWQFSKSWAESTDNPDINKSMFFKLDIFNDEIIRERDTITVYYDEFPIKLVHPSITLSYRMRYALDVRGATAFKYWEKMKVLMDNAKSYYNNLRAIQQMNMRVHEHNVSITNNKEKLSRIRSLVQRREINIDDFFNKVFDQSIPETMDYEDSVQKFLQTIKK
jgi:hypothetical protein